MGIAPQTIPIPKWGISSSLRPTHEPRDRNQLAYGDQKLPSLGDRRSRGDSSQPSHNDSNSRRDSLLLLYYFVRQTEEGALHKSTSISQWEYTCDNWGRPDFDGPFSYWRRTPIQPISITTLAESRNFLNPSQRQCLLLMENQRNSSGWRSVPNEFENP